MPRVALFVPCYIDQFYPDVAWASLELLKQVGIQAEIPDVPTCCGQPMANTGCVSEARPLADQFVGTMKEYDHIVCPSGSCTAMVRHHYHGLVTNEHDYEQVQAKTFELTEYLVDVAKVSGFPTRFPHRVGLHQSCHGLRELRLGSSTETIGPRFSKAQQLLEMLDGIQLVTLTRPDECCGFGGTFAVNEEAISCQIGRAHV